MAAEPKQPPEPDAAADVEREIRRGRPFSLSAAIGRPGGSGMLKGAVLPVSPTKAMRLTLRFC